MTQNISIDPITRIEGHLAIRIETEAGKVVNAFSSGEMFRGFEIILKGRDPLDAQQITQRICGVCPVSHGTASVLSQDMAYGVTPPKNGRLARNIILASNYIQSHIIHFYHLSALDFVDITAITKYQGNDPALKELKEWVKVQLASNSLYPAAPFLPRYEGKYIEETELNLVAIKHYLEALEMRTLAHKMAAIFGGKLPHPSTLVPGGVTENVTEKKIAELSSILKRLKTFIETAYVPDVIEVARAFPEYFEMGRGCGNFLAYGVFPESDNNLTKLFPSGVIIRDNKEPFDESKITEDVKYSKFSSESGLHPQQGKTRPDPKRNGAYSWLKAPRYNNEVMEVGPLARVLVSYHHGNENQVKTQVDTLVQKLGLSTRNLISVLGRHAARALECKIIADRCGEWIDELVPDNPVFNEFNIPETGEGAGLTEAPRGALGHWLSIKNYRIDNYQCIVPTTWNASPRDDNNTPGAIEQALVGTMIADANNPLEATRVVRSFDPCIACAVH